MKLTDLESGEVLEIGYCFVFAPLHPINAEDMEAYSRLQLIWLERWAPLPGDWPQ